MREVIEQEIYKQLATFFLLLCLVLAGTLRGVENLQQLTWTEWSGCSSSSAGCFRKWLAEPRAPPGESIGIRARSNTLHPFSSIYCSREMAGTRSSPAAATSRMGAAESRFTYTPDDARATTARHRRERGVTSAGNDEDAPECSFSCASVPSCAGMVIADCIALCCCCPCAAVSLLALALLRVPWALGRKCYRHLKTNRAARRRVVAEDQGKKANKKSKKQQWTAGGEESTTAPPQRGGYYYDDGDEDGGSWDVQDEYEAMGRCSCAWREAEKVWMELYQAGQIGIGFGRVSFTGLPHRRSAGRSSCSS